MKNDCKTQIHLILFWGFQVIHIYDENDYYNILNFHFEKTILFSKKKIL